MAAGDECPDRPYCEPGPKSTYGIDITGIDPKGVGTPQSKQAVKDGTDQLVLTTATDATLDQFNLVLLTDDKHLQNADNVLPLVNAKDAGDQGVADALDKQTQVLTTQDLTNLNEKVDAERLKPADVAADHLKSKGPTTWRGSRALRGDIITGTSRRAFPRAYVDTACASECPPCAGARTNRAEPLRIRSPAAP